MNIKFSLTEETLGYVTAESDTNTDRRNLIAGSQNVLIDFNRSTGIRNGITRDGSGSSAATEVRNAWTWLTSTGDVRPFKFFDDEWQVRLTTIDGLEINDYVSFASGMDDTAIVRGKECDVFDMTEGIDTQMFVQGDSNLYEWNGAVVVVASFTTNTITKAGTSTFAQSRAYHTRDMIFVNIRTGVEYTYTGGTSTLTVTGVTPDPTGDLVAGDILVQKLVTYTNTPVASRNNDTIFVFDNQVCVGSESDETIYISQNDDVADYTFSTPRVSGEGALLTLDGPSRGFGVAGETLVAFAGESSIFTAVKQQITVGTTLAETLKVKKLDTGEGQGSLNPDCIVSIGNAIAYLSNEVALRIIENPETLNGLDPRTFSNPIKPDFDAEDWTRAKMVWHKNALKICATATSRMYFLQFREDADGKVRRFWQPPLTAPVGSFSIIDQTLYGHSNATPESYVLFDPNRYSDIVVNGDNDNPDDKLPIYGRATRAYISESDSLDTFDLYKVEGQISPTTLINLDINYDYQGETQVVNEVINGNDTDILHGFVASNSLAQASLGTNPMGGLLNPPATARKFEVEFEEAREDFSELNVSFWSDEVDQYWAIISDGPNITRSPRRNLSVRR